MNDRPILPHLNTEPAPGDAFFDVSTGTAYQRVRDGWRVMTRQDILDLLLRPLIAASEELARAVTLERRGPQVRHLAQIVLDLATPKGDPT